MSVSSVIGKRGEQTAAHHLAQIGHTIREKNYRSKYGEIDIISSVGSELVFTEVKTWRGLEKSSLEHALNHKKIGRIIRSAESYLSLLPENSDWAVRFDVILIDPDTRRVDHIEHAFTENGC